MFYTYIIKVKIIAVLRQFTLVNTALFKYVNLINTSINYTFIYCKFANPNYKNYFCIYII